jgi:hypothetical protein
MNMTALMNSNGWPVDKQLDQGHVSELPQPPKYGNGAIALLTSDHAGRASRAYPGAG